MKKLILGILALLVVVVLAGGYVVKARATFNIPSFHTEWTYGPWSNWSECKPNLQLTKDVVSDETPVCGENGVTGTQTRHRTKVCVVKLGSGQNECSLGQTEKEYESRDCPIEVPPCEEPTPTPTPEDVPGNPPTFAGSSTDAPVCTDGNTINLPANPHVLRAGDKATVNFFITEGDSANVYWKEVNASDWQHSIADVKPNSDKFVSVEIGGLDKNLGYTFGIQQKKGCGGGQLVTAVVIDGPEAQLFQFSYWEWSK